MLVEFPSIDIASAVKESLKNTKLTDEGGHVSASFSQKSKVVITEYTPYSWDFERAPEYGVLPEDLVSRVLLKKKKGLKMT